MPGESNRGRGANFTAPKEKPPEKAPDPYINRADVGPVPVTGRLDMSKTPLMKFDVGPVPVTGGLDMSKSTHVSLFDPVGQKLPPDVSLFSEEPTTKNEEELPEHRSEEPNLAQETRKTWLAWAENFGVDTSKIDNDLIFQDDGSVVLTESAKEFFGKK